MRIAPLITFANLKINIFFQELIAKVPHNNVSRSPEACKTQEVDGLMQLVSLLHTVSKDVWNKMAEDGNDNESVSLYE